MKNTLPPRSVIADSGFWVAFGNRRDRHHLRAQELFAALDAPLVATWPVVTEASYLLFRDLGADAQQRFLSGLERGGALLFDLTTEHLPRMGRLMRQYADLPMDLADASLVILAEELGHGRILSTDRRDFASYRWKNRRPFENLLLPE